MLRRQPYPVLWWLKIQFPIAEDGSYSVLQVKRPDLPTAVALELCL
jgi:hypothetical protein